MFVRFILYPGKYKMRNRIGSYDKLSLDKNK